MTIGESIKKLLEAGNKVVLPGFGHLKKVEVEQSPSPSGKHLAPPGAKIRFSNSSGRDDGLLAKTWSQDGQVNEEEAQQRVLELVDAIRFALDKGEEYELAAAGKFRRDDNGKIHFSPEKGWTLHPDQFGLEDLELEELEEEKGPDAAPGASSGAPSPAAPTTIPPAGTGAADLGKPAADLGKPTTEEKPADQEKPGSEKKPASEEKPGRTRTRQFGPAVERDASGEPKKKPAPKAPTRKPAAKAPARKTPARKPAPASGAKKDKKDRPHRKTKLWRVIWVMAALMVVVLAVLLFVPAEKLPFLSGEGDFFNRQEQAAEGTEGADEQAAGTTEETEEQGDPRPDMGQTEDAETASGGDPATQTSTEETVAEPPDEPVAEAPAPEADHAYFLIAGSFSTVVRASDLQDELKAKGYDAQVLSTGTGKFRVSVASFADKREAERELMRLKQEPGFEALWLLVNR